LKRNKKSYITSHLKRQNSSRGSSKSKESSASKASSKQSKNSKGFTSNPFTGMRRPSSGRKTASSSKKQILNGKPEEEHKSSTFLTGVMHNAEGMAKLDERIKTEFNIDFYENDENINTQQNNYEMELINAYEETLNESRKRKKKYFEDSSSQNSDFSDHEVDFVKENLERVGPEYHKSYLNRLNDTEKKRLQELEDEIDQSFLWNDEYSKKIISWQTITNQEKLELMSALVPASEAGERDIITGYKNAYLYDDPGRIEKINDELKTKFLALPPLSEDESINDDITSMKNLQSSVHGDRASSEKDFDIFSERSAHLTMISKRSGITSISHSLMNKLSKPLSLPKEKTLRDKAEEKILKQNLKEIDDWINKTRSDKSSQIMSDDQMSKLIQEWRRENERAQMLETAEEDEDDDDKERDTQSKVVALYEEDNSKLAEAKEFLDLIIKQKEALEKGLPLPTGPGDQLAIESVDNNKILEENKKLNKVESSLKKQLIEQENYLANLMKEIEEKEEMLKKAIEENNKYLEIEGGVIPQEDGISARSAAYKFSSARGNLLRPNRHVNPNLPNENIIEELHEESDEEENKLDAMIEAAQNFNNEFEYEQSHSKSIIGEEKTTLFYMLSKATTEEERDKILQEYRDSNDEYYEENENQQYTEPIEETQEEGNDDLFEDEKDE